MGDLVRDASTEKIGFVLEVQKDFYGCTTSFKRDPNKDVRGECIDTRKPDFIGPTKSGILDRVLVMWTDDSGFQYFMGDELEMISENG